MSDTLRAGSDRARPKPPAPDEPAAAPSRPGARAAGPTARFLIDLAYVAAAILAAWWLVVALLAPEPFLLPGPGRVAAALVARWGDLWPNALVTLGEILLGLAAGVSAGVATALGMGLFPASRRFVTPFVVVLQSLPVFAIAPVLVLWFGFGLASKIVMATLIIFFPVASAFGDGLARTDPGLLDLARLYRTSHRQTLALIRIPAALPSLVSGLRMAAAVAPIGAIVGEWVGASSGLGLLMMHANARLQTDVMFAALALVVAMAVVLRLAVDQLTRGLAPWLPETDRPETPIP